MTEMSRENREQQGQQIKEPVWECLVSVPDCGDDPAIDRVIGLGDRSVIFREYEETFLLTPEKDRFPLTGELHQPLFGTSSFLCVEGGSTVVRRRFDPSAKQIIEEFRLELSHADLGDSSRKALAKLLGESPSWNKAREIATKLFADPSADLNVYPSYYIQLREMEQFLKEHQKHRRDLLAQNVDGLTHMVTCSEASTVGVVYNNNLVLLRVNDDGTLKVDHSTLLEGNVVAIAARENDVVAAIYEDPTEYDGWNGAGINAKIRLHSSRSGELLGTLKLDGFLGAGEGNPEGLIAFSGNGKMVAYTADNGVDFDVCVSTVPDAGSNIPPREVHTEGYDDRGDAMAFDTSGGRLAVTTADREFILDVMMFDYNGEYQGMRRTEILYTPTIYFDQGGDLMMVQFRSEEGESEKNVAELVRLSSEKQVNTEPVEQSLTMPPVDRQFE
jgi:hypothetical protein